MELLAIGPIFHDKAFLAILFLPLGPLLDPLRAQIKATYRCPI